MAKEKKRFEIELVKEKETKGTVRYKEVPKKGQPEILRTVYVQKWLVGTFEEAPEKIKMVIEL